jgi:hypothetical protein
MKTTYIILIQIATILGAWYALDAYLYATDGYNESPAFGLVMATIFFVTPHLVSYKRLRA